MKARYLILIILIISVLPFVNNSIATHTPADFINITNNAELASHSVSGSGIAGDPYFLNSSEMFINIATGSTTYILNITGTDAFFVIDSFELRSPHYTTDNVTLIHLTDVSNAVIQNSELWFGPHEIQLIRCNNINITNNIIRTYYTGVEIAGTTNSLIQGNIFTGNTGIYFSPIERDYVLINAGNKKASENFTIKDNIFTGGIDTYFQFQYTRKAFFTHTFENNSYVDEYDVNIYTNYSPWLIISNVDTVDLKNQLIGVLFIFNVSNVILDNVVYRSDIYRECN